MYVLAQIGPFGRTVQSVAFSHDCGQGVGRGGTQRAAVSDEVHAAVGRCRA